MLTLPVQMMGGRGEQVSGDSQQAQSGLCLSLQRAGWLSPSEAQPPVRPRSGWKRSGGGAPAQATATLAGNPHTLIKTRLPPDPTLPSHSPLNWGPSEPPRLIKKPSEGIAVSRHLPPAPPVHAPCLKPQRDTSHLSPHLGSGLLCAVCCRLPPALVSPRIHIMQSSLFPPGEGQAAMSQLQPHPPTDSPAGHPNLGSPFLGGVGLMPLSLPLRGCHLHHPS